jgi:hypothetical protein
MDEKQLNQEQKDAIREEVMSIKGATEEMVDKAIEDGRVRQERYKWYEPSGRTEEVKVRARYYILSEVMITEEQKEKFIEEYREVSMGFFREQMAKNGWTGEQIGLVLGSRMIGFGDMGNQVIGYELDGMSKEEASQKVAEQWAGR